MFKFVLILLFVFVAACCATSGLHYPVATSYASRVDLNSKHILAYSAPVVKTVVAPVLKAGVVAAPLAYGYGQGYGYGLGYAYGLGYGRGLGYGSGYNYGLGYGRGIGYGNGYNYGLVYGHSLNYGHGLNYNEYGNGVYGYGNGGYLW